MILVTGATGHIGNVLVRELCARGTKVRTLLLPGDDGLPLAHLPVEIVEGDVLDPDSLLKAMQDVTVVFHLAGLITILPGQNEMVRRVNVVGTRNVLEAAKQAGVRRLVYASSIHALERVPDGVVIDELVPIDTVGLASEYDSSKALATLEVLKAAKEGLDAVVVCPTGVIGPYDYRESEMGRLILDAMKSKVQFSVDGAYDFVDVRDIAEGLIRACEFGEKGQHYILSGERITVPKIMAIVRELTGKNAIHIDIPMWTAKLVAVLAEPFYRLMRLRPRFTTYALATVTSNSYISHARAARDLGYSPRPIRRSIADTIKWFKENAHLPKRLPKSSSRAAKS